MIGIRPAMGMLSPLPTICEDVLPALPALVEEPRGEAAHDEEDRHHEEATMPLHGANPRSPRFRASSVGVDGGPSSRRVSGSWPAEAAPA